MTAEKLWVPIVSLMSMTCAGTCAQVLACIAPGPDDIVLPKTSSSVFCSTNVDYVLRSLGVKYLILAGCVTDQCVESAVRDACDHHYYVTLVTGDKYIRHPNQSYCEGLNIMLGSDSANESQVSDQPWMAGKD